MSPRPAPMSGNASAGRPSPTACTPTAVAAHLGLRWPEVITWDRLLDLCAAAYWQRRPGGTR